MEIEQALQVINRITRRRCKPRLRCDAFALATERYYSYISKGTQVDNVIGLVNRITLGAISDTVKAESHHRVATQIELSSIADHRNSFNQVDADDLLVNLTDDPIVRRIVELRASGHTFREISESLKMPNSTVARRIETVKDHADLSPVS